jgi:hypothetical protein
LCVFARFVMVTRHESGGRLAREPLQYDAV